MAARAAEERKAAEMAAREAEERNKRYNAIWPVHWGLNQYIASRWIGDVGTSRRALAKLLWSRAVDVRLPLTAAPGGIRMSNNALRTARKVWKQIKYDLEDRSVLELGSADDDLIEEVDAEQIKEIDADQIKDIEKAINDAIRTLIATGSWPADQRDP